MSSVPQLAHFKLPTIGNEPMYKYTPGSSERKKLLAALEELRAQAPLTVPCVVNGEKITSGQAKAQVMPHEHQTVLCHYHQADEATVQKAIDGALTAKKAWEALPFNDRAAIFLKAADLLAHKYRYKVMAATMLGQGKNIWQAEIDAAAELCDFWRFNCKYAEELYHQQPPMNATGTWNRTEYRPLEGFVYAVSPFNFTAIGGNLVSAPALMGKWPCNVALWKPSDMAVYSNYLVYEILQEAGLPAGVVQFIPGPAPEVTKTVLDSPHFASLHFTGSTFVFRHLWKEIGNRIDTYKSYPRIVGETGGKNFHVLHKSADVTNTVHQTIRAAFEYQGQKCSACSRAYIPQNLWARFKSELVAEVNQITVGSVEEPSNFITPVINKVAFDRIKSYIDAAREASDAEIIAGGECNDEVGYFIQPTVIVTTNLNFKTLKEEIFGPVLTIYVYPTDQFEQILDTIDAGTQYGLTGAIFAADRQAVVTASNRLRNAAGNFYINDKCTGAVVGQQPFGGARGSGTNDKAGSASLLYRFVSARSIKESFLPVDGWSYPSNLV
ncbi:delta-1-pyrroline-5-carboxylate dehydrogenase [Thamnocephalis sphaerospora]|uniref:Multifunctional fusion protein n=1 Tax=Thamnocephalis sphaerospora TaxID=78915 RepID=A0A4P9XKA3_9FUNG|nr:delta-1-pyrroline-5-carboxylate dehydrogenase [Thamnocephalis sphaerospora]|eukprot:RKP06195.1 delta-1-pyrroline-5-carboxylate dehydrogenase [Thamnocephalis sphaerospora]